VAPADLKSFPERNGQLHSLGAGDTLAGAATLLLGRSRDMRADDAIVEAIRFAHAVATAHVAGSEWSRTQLQRHYVEVRGPFEPGPTAPSEAGRPTAA
jgi:hypothetical protein